MARATRNRTSAAAAVVEEEEEAQELQVEEQEEEETAEEGTLMLQFNEPLSWKAGKAIPVATLIKRLTALFDELQGLEQEEDINRESFATVAKELAAPNLLGHRDDGVKAYTACCLAEILRIHAPDAPYTGPQLKVWYTGLKAHRAPLT